MEEGANGYVAIDDHPSTTPSRVSADKACSSLAPSCASASGLYKPVLVVAGMMLGVCLTALHGNVTPLHAADAPSATTLLAEAGATNYYLMKSTPKSGMAAAWWKKVAAMSESDDQEAAKLGLKIGIYTTAFMPLVDGPIYAVVETRAGITDAFLQKAFVDPFDMGMLSTELMPIDTKLAGMPPMPSVFDSFKGGMSMALSANLSKIGGVPNLPHLRRMRGARDVSLLESGGGSSFYLAKATIKSGMAAAMWKKANAMTESETTQIVEDYAKVGLCLGAFLPIGFEGPVYSVLESYAGAAEETIQATIDKNSWDMSSTELMLIDTKLSGGDVESAFTCHAV